MNSLLQILSNSDFVQNEDKVWHAKEIGEFAYNDGDEAELYLLNVIKNAEDKSCRSTELASKMIDWPSTYHLTSRRANLLRPFEAKFKNKRVLEIGCGCGAITRFLGEAGAEVVSVEGSFRRASIARARCEDLNNVEVICSSSDKLPDLGKFDYVLLIGVLEYARMFLGENGQAILLDSCRSKLDDDGKLFVAIENKVGIKYFAGAFEDHVGQQMYGINNSYERNGVVTFGREELKSLVSDAGFNHVEEYLPLPDYKLPTDVVTPLGWKKYSKQLSQIAVESAHKDIQGIAEPVFSIEQALKSVWRNELSADLSNSFLFVASPNQFSYEDNTLLHHYSDGRLPEYNKNLIIIENGSNGLEVLTSSANKNFVKPDENHNFFHESVERTPFFPGESLWLNLIDILNKPGWKKTDIQAWLDAWIRVIVREENIETSIDKDTLLPGKYNDAMPFNILVDGKNNVKFIDLEWIAQESISLGYIVFRGVLHSLLRVTSVSNSIDGENLNLQQLLEDILLSSTLNIEHGDVESYWEREFVFMEQTQIGDVANIRNAFSKAVLKTRVSLIDYAVRNAALQSKITEYETIVKDSINKECVELSEVYDKKIASLTDIHDENVASLKAIVQTFEQQNAELSETNELLHKSILEQKEMLERLEQENSKLHQDVNNNINSASSDKSRLLQLEKQNHNNILKINELNAEVNRLISTNSWKITKPLRFSMRLLRGQHQIALQPLKSNLRNKLKGLYYQAPVQYRRQLLEIAFKVRPTWFVNHPEYQKRNGSFSNIDSNTQQLLVDINSLPATLSAKPQNVALHCHIFYHDLISEFSHHISQVPFELDVFVSVTTQEGLTTCKSELEKLSNIRKLVVEIVPNRGRDIGPMFAHFGSRLKVYDYVGHIQSKKSLYNAGATLGWREYLFNALLGSRENVERIFHQFETNPALGIVYPQAFVQVPYAAFTWLANKADGHRLCNMMGIEMPEAYFNFPAGSMFWARMSAMRPLFDLNLKWEDFPEELAQNDGTVAHAIERLLGIVPTALNYDSLIIKDKQSPSWSTFRFDQQYFGRTFDMYQYLFNDHDTHLVAFDIFDTILTRPLLNPDHTKKIVVQYLEEHEKEAFIKHRANAEAQARNNAGKDVDIYNIYKVFGTLTGYSEERCKQIADLESKVEYSSVYLRPDAKELMLRAKNAGKKVVLVSDMFLSKSTIVDMLNKFDISCWDELYLSSDIGYRKDTGKLYEYVFDNEGIKGENLVMIGDNERSDLQLPADFFKTRCLHLLRANDIAKSLTDYKPLIGDLSISNDLNNEITLGLIIQKNLNKVASIEPDDLRLYSERPYQLGYNLVGPLLVSFCDWLYNKSNDTKTQHLFFLAREGKIIKEVFDKWNATYEKPIPGSSYLQLSRRSVNVPKIKNFEHVKEIAAIDFYPNELATFLFERYGLELNNEKWQEIFDKGLWNNSRKVEVRNKDISNIEPVLQYLLPEIMECASNENKAMSHYLESTGITHKQDVAIVDVGYSGTIQKSLIQLLDKPVNGFYMATSNLIRNDLNPQALAEGCFVSNSLENFADSRIFSKSFALEQLLSANDAQIAKYVLSENGELEKVFKPLRDEELATQPIRNELQRGIMDFVAAAIEIKSDFYPLFTPSLYVADKLYTGFVDSGKDKQNSVLQQLVLDDDYCGRGLVS